MPALRRFVFLPLFVALLLWPSLARAQDTPESVAQPAVSQATSVLLVHGTFSDAGVWNSHHAGQSSMLPCG